VNWHLVSKVTSDRLVTLTMVGRFHEKKSNFFFRANFDFSTNTVTIVNTWTIDSNLPLCLGNAMLYVESLDTWFFGFTAIFLTP